jgi:NAD(P)H-hydrate epimerase
MSGSVAMSAIAALHCGAGLVTAAVPDRCLETVAGFHPALMTIPLPDSVPGCFALEAAGELATSIGSTSAIGCGPGMTTGPGSLRIVDRLISRTDVPRVFDADAINTIAMHDMLAGISDAGPMVLTPHPGELQRLTGAPPTDRPAQIAAAQRMAADHGLVVVVKGGPTVTVCEAEVWTNTTGNPGMATAGTGDVLTGVITSLLAQGLSPFDAARLGVWIHGKAGDLAARQHGQAGMTAIEILREIGSAVAEAQQ